MIKVVIIFTVSLFILAGCSTGFKGPIDKDSKLYHRLLYKEFQLLRMEFQSVESEEHVDKDGFANTLQIVEIEKGDSYLSSDGQIMYLTKDEMPFLDEYLSMVLDIKILEKYGVNNKVASIKDSHE